MPEGGGGEEVVVVPVGGGGEEVGQHINAAPLQFRVEQGLTGLEFGHGSQISRQSEKDTPGKHQNPQTTRAVQSPTPP